MIVEFIFQNQDACEHPAKAFRLADEPEVQDYCLGEVSFPRNSSACIHFQLSSPDGEMGVVCCSSMNKILIFAKYRKIILL